MPPGPNDKQGQQSTIKESPQTLPHWLTDAEKFLTDNGWKKISVDKMGNSVWSDPLGSYDAPKLSVDVILPTQGGGNETIKQMCGPPIPWNWKLEEAMEIQNARNLGKANKK